MKDIEIIGMPMKYGCMVEGADLAYSYLKVAIENQHPKIITQKQQKNKVFRTSNGY